MSWGHDIGRVVERAVIDDGRCGVRGWCGGDGGSGVALAASAVDPAGVVRGGREMTERDALIARLREIGAYLSPSTWIDLSDRGVELIAIADALSAPPPVPTADRDKLIALADCIQAYYDFSCTGGPISMCIEWQQLRAALSMPPPALWDALGAPPAQDYEALLREVLASGKPNPSNHPTMTAAWTKAAHALRDEELMRAYPLPPAPDRSDR